MQQDNVPASVSATTAAAAAANTPSSTSSTPGGTAGSFDMNSTVSSLGELKKKAPEVWNAIMQGIAQNIINDWSNQQARLKQQMEEDRRRDNENS